MDSFLNDLDRRFGASVSNILFLPRHTDGSAVIGWLGTEGRRWFPFTMGRFFTAEEQANGDHAAFVSDSFVQAGGSVDSVFLYDTPFRIVNCSPSSGQ